MVVANTRQEYLPLEYYFERRDAPLEPFPLVENPKTHFKRVTSKRKAKAQMRAAKHVLIIDRKTGNRSKKLIKSMRKRWDRIATRYWDGLRVDELVRTRKDGRPVVKVKPLGAGKHKRSSKKVRRRRRVR